MIHFQMHMNEIKKMKQQKLTLEEHVKLLNENSSNLTNMNTELSEQLDTLNKINFSLETYSKKQEKLLRSTKKEMKILDAALDKNKLENELLMTDLNNAKEDVLGHLNNVQVVDGITIM